MTDLIRPYALAFPIPESQWWTDHSDFHGLTKREYFAGLAMQGILAGRNNGYSQGDDYARGSVAASALVYADALLAELAK